MGLEQKEVCHASKGGVLSPSHTVGLELKPHSCRATGRVRVAIPHGGLRTGEVRITTLPTPRSPSHTVGLEPTRRTITTQFITSHHPTQWAQNILVKTEEIFPVEQFMSPSHTVGLELSKIVDYLRDLAESLSHAVGSGHG